MKFVKLIGGIGLRSWRQSILFSDSGSEFQLNISNIHCNVIVIAVAAVRMLKKAPYSSRSHIDSIVGSPIAVELFWWHFALVIPTIGFKYLYVRRLSFTTGLWTILDSVGEGAERYWNLLLLPTVDVLEVSLIVGGLFVVGRLLLRVPAKALIFTSVFLSLMIMGANQYSLLLVANLATVDTLVISAHWAKEHPYVVWQSVTAAQLGFFLLALSWSSFFAGLPSRVLLATGIWCGVKALPYSLLLKSIVLVSVLGWLTMLRIGGTAPIILRGYWSSALVSFFKLDAPALPMSSLPSAAAIQADYERLVFPKGKDPEPRWLAVVPQEKLVPRHILIVVLETAPQRYYPLADNPALPVFYEMSQRAIVSNHHYAMSPYTWWNNASILSGNYFIQKGKGIFDYGEFGSDSIATILGARGYRTTFIDSFKLGWVGTTGFWKNLGFADLLDSVGDLIPYDSGSYTVTVDKERQSFGRALEAILKAEAQNKKALVMVGTAIGHYPWQAKPGRERDDNVEKLFGIATIFDELFGELLRSLKQHGLNDQVLIVVTGDHGFRMRTEFESVGLKAEHGEAAFNVPFLLYGPGVFKEQIRLPYVTSHVDIAPTLLALTGVKENSWLHHGTNMLDQRLRDRVTFMMNTNLSPASGFRWNGCHYTLNELTEKVHRVGTSSNTDSKPTETSQCTETSEILSDGAVRLMLEEANRQFQITFAYFQQRKTPSAQKRKP